ncbi:substrate-binding domain-containing protein [Microbispora sp. NBC_01189]|uniref:hypothetical protein n=1 Tax=Microbispora sp. NBC_01189 TaxID=2903583 RepID=UPI002E0D9529|nr:substrate-binding domain-containing protein [Microbispora sp. NBC_01189]
MRDLRHGHPDADVRTPHLDWNEPRAALLDRRVDAVVTRLPLRTGDLRVTVLHVVVASRPASLHQPVEIHLDREGHLHRQVPVVDPGRHTRPRRRCPAPAVPGRWRWGLDGRGRLSPRHRGGRPALTPERLVGAGEAAWRRAIPMTRRPTAG